MSRSSRLIARPRAVKSQKRQWRSLRVESLEDRTVPATIQWNTDNSGSWHDPANWDLSRVPNSSDVVILDRGPANPVITVSNPVTVAALTANESIHFTNGTFQSNSSFTLNAPWQLSGGFLYANGSTLTLTLAAPGFWTGGNLGNDGVIVNHSTLTVGNGTNKILDSDLTNFGTILHTGSESVGSNRATFVNESTGVYEFRGDGDYVNDIGREPFRNRGVVRKSAGTAESAFTDIPFLNEGGTLDVRTGTLRIGSTMTSSQESTGGHFHVESNATLQLSSYPKASPPPDFSGTYTADGGGRIELDGAIKLSGVVTFDFPAGMFHWTSGLITGGTLVNDGFMTISGVGTRTIVSATLENRGTLIQTDTNTLANGAGGGTDKFFNAAGAVFEIRGTLQTTSGLALENAGTLRKLSSTTESLFVNPVTLTGGTIVVDSGRLRFTERVDFVNGLNAEVGQNGILQFDTRLRSPMAGTLQGAGNGRVEFTKFLRGASGADPEPVLNFPEGMLHWLGGDVTDNVINAGHITFDGAIDHGFHSGTFTNQGTIVHRGTAAVRLFDNGGGATFVNAGDYVLESDVNILIASAGGSGSTERFTNTGTFRKTGGTGISIVGDGANPEVLVFDNQGTVEALAGTLELGEQVSQVSSGRLTGGNWVVGPAATLTLAGGAITVNEAEITLKGSGSVFTNLSALNQNSGTIRLEDGRDLTLAGGLTNNGRLKIGAESLLSVSGDFDLQPDSEIETGIADSPASGRFGQIAVAGNAAIDGALSVNLQNGFGPALGDAYGVLTYSSKTGEFAITTGIGPFFTAQISPSDVVLTTIATPPDLVALEIHGPATATVGQSATFSYTVANRSSAPATGDWVDSIYLDRDGRLGPDSILVARVPQSGEVGGSSTYTGSVTVEMPAAIDGEYHLILVTDSQANAADLNRTNNRLISSSVIDVHVPTLVLDVPATGSIQAGAEIYFRLDAVGADDVLLTLETTEGQQVDLSAAYRILPTDIDLGITPVATHGPVQRLSILSSLAGPYYVRLQGLPWSGAGSAFRLTARRLPMTINEVQGLTAANIGRATSVIAGVGFTPDTRVQLRRNDDTVVTEASVRFESGSELTATFELTGIAVGYYRIVAFRADAEAVAPEQYEVIVGEPGELQLFLHVPTTVRPGRYYAGYLDYANIGNTDLDAPLLRLSSSRNERLTFDFTAIPVQTELQFMAINMGAGPAGVLRPGASGRIPFRFFNPSGGAEIVVDEVAPGYSVLIDWDAVKESLRPEGIPADWDTAFDRLAADSGPLWADYNRTIASAVTLRDERTNKRTFRPGPATGFLAETVWLDSRAELTARVSLGNTARPIGDVLVQALDAVTAQAVDSGLSAADGYIRFTNLPAGTYTFRFIDYLQPNSIPTITIPANGRVDAGDWIVRPGGEILGRIIAPGVRFTPEIGALEATGEDGTIYTGTIAPDGTFAIRGLPTGDYRVAFRSSALVAQDIGMIGVDEGVASNIGDIKGITGGSLSGRVTDSLGQPLTDILVLIRGMDGEVQTARTGIDGAYFFASVRPGDWTVTVDHPAYAANSLPAQVLADNPTTGIDFELSSSASLQGRVSSGGVPVSGAIVYLLDGTAAVHIATTKPDGTYQMPDLPGGDFTLRVDHAAFEIFESLVTIPNGTATTRDVSLTETTVVAVRLRQTATGTDEQPTAVLLASKTGHKVQYGTTTETDGTALFSRIAPGDYVAMLLDGSHRTPVTVTASTEPIEVTIDLTVGRIRGTVVDDNGQPIVGAVVELLHSGQVVWTTLTDSLGEYLIRLIDPGTYEVRAAANGLFIANQPGVVVANGQTTAIAPLAPGIQQLDVSVVDATTGDPVAPPGRITITRLDGPGRIERDVDKADTSFTGLAAGQYRVDAYFANRPDVRVAIDVPEQADPVSLTIPVGEAARLIGQVTVAGTPAAGFARVTAVSAADPKLRWEAVAGADGRYEFAPLPAGSYELVFADADRVDGVDYAPVTRSSVVLGAGAEHIEDATMTVSNVSVFGRILPDGSHLPPAAVVRAMTLSGVVVAETRAEFDGSFTLVGLASGSYRLTAEAEGFTSMDVSLIVGASSIVSDVAIPTAWRVDPTNWGDISWWSDSAAFNNGFSGSLTEFLRNLFGEPQDTAGKLPHLTIPPECQKALTWYQISLYYQAIKDQKYNRWVEKWEAAQQVLWANAGSLAVKLLGALAGIKGNVSKAKVEAEALGSADEALDAARLLPTLRPDSPSYQVVSQQLRDANEKYHRLMYELGLFDGYDLLVKAESNYRGATVAEFFKTWGNINNWKSVTDVVTVVNDALGLANQLAGTIGIFLQAVDVIRGFAGANPALAGAISVLDKIATWAEIIKDGLQTITDVSKDIEALSTAEAEYKDIVSKRDQAYQYALQSLHNCEDDEDDDTPDPCDMFTNGKCPDFRERLRRILHLANSSDPNEKLTSGAINPADPTASGYVRAGDRIAYTVLFENKPEATAPAQEVFITDILPPEIDPASYEIGMLGFADVIVPVDAGRLALSTRVDLSDSHGLYVDVIATFDPTSRTARWTFRSIDPATGDLVGDALAGFLPPEDGTGRGQGFVTFFARLKSDLPDGTRAENKAEIVFDTNAPLVTNTTANRVDALAPSAQIGRLFPIQTSPTFQVSWSGNDPNNGSGIGSYDVYVSVDEGPFEIWLDDTTAVTGLFAGEFNRRYDFFATAHDRVGNSELRADTSEASTLVIEPVAAIDDAYGVLPGKTLIVPGAKGLLANDVNTRPKRRLKAMIVDEPQHGTLTLRPHGAFTYVPGPSYTGRDFFTYEIRDNTGRTSNRARVDLAEQVVSFKATAVRALERRGEVAIGVELWQPAAGAQTVEYVVTPGTARGDGEDFSLADGILTFEDGERSKTIVIPIENDRFNEALESFQIWLTNPSGNAVVGRQVATISVFDNDPRPKASFRTATSQGVEGALDAIDVMLSSPSGRSVTVPYIVRSWTARSGHDFVLTNGTLTFAPGQTERTIVIPRSDDALDESDERFTITLGRVVNAVRTGPVRHVRTILDNDPPPIVSFAAPESVAMETDKFLDIEVTLSEPSARTVLVSLEVVAGTAKKGKDFFGTPRMVIFRAGETTKRVRIRLVNDRLQEAEELVELGLSSSTNATIGLRPTHSLRIVDDDGP